MNKRAAGVIFSYLLIAVDVLVALFFVPFLLKMLGDHEYGMYKLLLSTASYLSVLDFGLGGTITRYVVKYKTEGNQQKQENFVAMGLVIYSFLAIVLIAIALVVCMIIPSMYRQSIPAEQMGQAQQIYFFMCLSQSISLFSHAYVGLFSAYEKFVYIKASNILRVVLRVVLIVAGQYWWRSAMFVVIIDLGLNVALLAVHILFARLGIRYTIKLHKWDGKLAKEALVFTSAIFLQVLIYQMNTNINNVLLGVFTTTASVALYSLVLQIYTMYSGFSTTINDVYLPSISAAVFQGATKQQITQKVVEPSRIQLSILLMIFTGFVLLGREFIMLWVGDDYQQVYVLVLILMGASILELTQNTIESILKAKNKLRGKSIIMGVTALLNFVVALLLVPRMGAWGSVVSTAISMILGYGVALNVFYHKNGHIDIFLYYKATYKGILPAGIISILLGYFALKIVPIDGGSGFVLRGICYVVIYGSLQYLVGLNKQEKNMVKSKIRMIIKR